MRRGLHLQTSGEVVAFRRPRGLGPCGVNHRLVLLAISVCACRPAAPSARPQTDPRPTPVSTLGEQQPAPETPPRGSFIVVAPGTRLLTAPRDDAEFLVLGWPGGASDYGATRVLEVRGESGGYLRVGTHLAEDSGEHCAAEVSGSQFDLEMFVLRGAAMRVLGRDVKLADGEHDSYVSAKAGTPVQERQGERWLVDQRVAVKAAVPDDALAGWYVEADVPKRDVDAAGFVSTLTPVVLPGTITADLRGRRVATIEDGEAYARVEFLGRCVDVALAFDRDHVVAFAQGASRALSGRTVDRAEGDRGHLDTTDAPSSWPKREPRNPLLGPVGRQVPTRYRVAANAGLTWADGAAAGVFPKSRNLEVPMWRVENRWCTCPSLSFVEASAGFAICVDAAQVAEVAVKGTVISQGREPMVGCSTRN